MKKVYLLLFCALFALNAFGQNIFKGIRDNIKKQAKEYVNKKANEATRGIINSAGDVIFGDGQNNNSSKN